MWDNAVAGGQTSPFATHQLTDDAGSMRLFPLDGHDFAFPFDMTANTMFLNMSITANTQVLSRQFSSSFFFAVYTSTADSLSLLNSASVSYGFASPATNNSSLFAGQRFLSFHSSQWSSSPVFSMGSRYHGALIWSSSSNSNTNIGVFGHYAYSTGSRMGTIGVGQSDSASHQGMAPFYGMYSTTTAGFPAAIANSEINKQLASALFTPHVVMVNNTGASSF